MGFGAATRIVSASILWTCCAQAEDSVQRRDIEASSRAIAFPKESASLYSRAPGRNSEVVGETLLARWAASSEGVRTNGTFSVRHPDGDYVARGADWLLEVRAGASVVRYQNLTAGKGQTVPLAERLRLTDLVGPANAFVERELGELVVIVQGEALIPLNSRYELHSEHSPDGTRGEPRVAMASLTFGRLIEGVPVVGDGSRVTVYFDAFGEITLLEVWRITGWDESQSLAQPVLAITVAVPPN